jgi:hypothetical protein
MSSNAGPAAPRRAQPLPNQSPRRGGPHQPRRKLRQRLRRKDRPPPQLQHPRPPQRSNLPPEATPQRWKRDSLLTKVPQKPDVRPTRSCGSTCRQRSIISQERGATAPRNAVPTCARRTQWPLKIAPPKPKNIPKVKSKASSTRRYLHAATLSSLSMRRMTIFNALSGRGSCYAFASRSWFVVRTTGIAFG